MRVSALILPVYPWREGRHIWREAEDLGFHAAYTYDHLSWRDFRFGPWFGAVPTLTAAAAATGRLRLGTMVTSPNFRHPVTLAKDLIALDDVSDGRITVGIGAGGVGFDATVLGQEPWSTAERTERFEEFVPLLDRLLTDPVTTHHGKHYSAYEARMVPGCVQRPRLPLAVAATGPRGLALAAGHGQAWITTGPARKGDETDPAEIPGILAGQLAALNRACAAIGRDSAELSKILLTGFTQEAPLESVEAFVDFAARYAEMGFDEIVVHRPVPGTCFDAGQGVWAELPAAVSAIAGNC
ncbi:LLM class flavin-dependent oxidoreductase [Catellatospora sp. KI3]|uniref:LLM class flavin-dependent oxidoreductase n=1 Tax=Catellatospora sp. KI3 TaxID=3041620 RepID=UPI002482EA1B|nr:LLM class flavin-dependent oxidoreductase [Catellatospora sp. KI3]MDI1464802.1 LLM class flavin-dependent oxidoreductase [Catellatospora sp. KI3]